MGRFQRHLDRSADRVILQIIDNGRGIEESVLTRIGKEWVSTKSGAGMGGGKGKGLFRAFQNARRLGMGLTVENQTDAQGVIASLGIGPSIGEILQREHEQAPLKIYA